MEIRFQEDIRFIELTIMKRQNCCQDRYENVCLVLDNDVGNQLCTDSNEGFSEIKDRWQQIHSSDHWDPLYEEKAMYDLNHITWKMPKDNVRHVALYFRDTDPYNGHAQIAELEIVYDVHGKFFHASHAG